MLTLIDECTRECLAIDVARNMRCDDVLERLAWLFATRGVPEHIRSDNGPEFTAKVVRWWLQRMGVKTLFIEPGSPWENGWGCLQTDELATIERAAGPMLLARGEKREQSVLHYRESQLIARLTRIKRRWTRMFVVVVPLSIIWFSQAMIQHRTLQDRGWPCIVEVVFVGLNILVIPYCLIIPLAAAVSAIGKIEQKIKNLQSAEANKTDLRSLIESHGAYALLLRDFRAENPYLRVTGMPGDIPVPLNDEFQSTLYKTALDPVKRSMPVFGLYSLRDHTDEDCFRRILVSARHWKDEFEYYVRHAALVVVLVDTPASGIIYELEYLRSSGAMTSTVYLGTASGLIECHRRGLLSNHAFTISGDREVLPLPDAPHVPEEAISFLRTTSKQRADRSGVSSLSFLADASAYITGVQKPTNLYYFGNHDPSGVDPRAPKSNRTW